MLGCKLVGAHTPAVVLGPLLAKQILQRDLAAHGYARLDFFQRCDLVSGRGRGSVKTVLAHGLEVLAGKLHTVAGVHCAIFNHLCVDGAVVGAGVWWGFAVDPEAIDAQVVCAFLVGGGVGWVSGLGGTVCASLAFGGIIGLDDHEFVCDLDVLSVGQWEVEVGWTATVQNESCVTVFAKFSLCFLADEETSFDTILFPLVCGWVDDVYDDVVGEGEDVDHRGFVTANY